MGNGESLFEYRVSVWDDEKVLGSRVVGRYRYLITSSLYLVLKVRDRGSQRFEG